MIFYRMAPNVNRAIFWGIMLYESAIFIPFAFLQFVLVFPNKQRMSSLLKILIYFSLIVMALITAVPGTVIQNIIFRGSGEKIIVWGNYDRAYIIYIIGYFTLSFVMLYEKYIKAKGMERLQIGFVLLGALPATLIGCFTNLILPSFGIFQFNWLGQIATLILITFIAYAIVKHHLMNIKVIATEMLSFFIAIILLVNALLAKSLSEFVINFFIFAGVAILGALLIRGILKEVEAKEKIKKLADDLAKANRKLKSANKELMRLDNAKSEFLSIASHQLRTPITAIKGLSSMLLEGDYGKISKVPKQTIDKIFTSSERMNKLVENLLNISRIESNKIEFDFEKTYLQNLVKEVIDEMIISINKKNLKIEVKIEKNIPMIFIDKQKIRQVVANFIDNSIKYTDEGVVNIELKMVKFSQLTKLLKKSFQYKGKKISAKTKKYLLFSIKDKGRGILADDQAYLFNKFTRGKGMIKVHTEGTGLGLYVCRKMIEAHDGFIWVDSKGEGQGSSFCFALKIGKM